MSTRSAIFRLEASDESGLGHLARCSALSRRLIETGWSVVIASSAASSVELLRRARLPQLTLEGGSPFTSQVLPPGQQRADANSLVSALSRAAVVPDWIVLDHYGMDRTWEREVRRTGAQLLVFEDLVERHHDVDLLVSDSPAPLSEVTTKKDASRDAIVLQGLKFALLDGAYDMPNSTVTRRRQAPFATTIVYGSGDPTKETERILAAMGRAESLNLGPINVVIGPTNHRALAISSIARTVPDIVVHSSIPSLASILRKTDVLFTAGGQVLLEGLAAGCACFVTVTADNQERVTVELVRAGAIELVSPSPSPPESVLDAALGKVAHRAPALFDQLQRHPAVDAFGCHRVVQAMERLSRVAVAR